MSERREHKRRYNEKLQFLAEFEAWMSSEPPMYRIFKWHKWKKSRPDRKW